MSEELKLPEARRQRKVTIGDEAYVLKEISGRQRDSFVKRSRESITFDDNGQVDDVKDPAKLQSFLLGMCLFDKAGETVPEEKLESGFGCTTLRALFQEARKLNGLDEESLAEAKNA